MNKGITRTSQILPHACKLDTLTLFITILYCRVKGTHIKITLDYLQSNDFEMAKEVLGGVDMVKDIFLFSDKCGPRELQKTYDEFAKDLKKLR